MLDTPILQACRNNDYESVLAIIKDATRPTVLGGHLRCRPQRTVGALDEQSVDDRDEIDQTPLIIASQHGCIEIVALLLKYGANIEHQNQQCETALISAAQEGHTDIVKLLLEAGADPKRTNSDGETALQLVIKYRQKKEIIDLLRMNLGIH